MRKLIRYASVGREGLKVRDEGFVRNMTCTCPSAHTRIDWGEDSAIRTASRDIA